LHLFSVRVKIFSFFTGSSICNSRDVKNHLDSDQMEIEYLSNVFCAAEGGTCQDLLTWIVSFYTFHFKRLTSIFIGSEVIQLLYCLCSFYTFCTQYYPDHHINKFWVNLIIYI
jgi:hypothetical protein